MGKNHVHLADTLLCLFCFAVENGVNKIASTRMKGILQRPGRYLFVIPALGQDVKLQTALRGYLLIFYIGLRGYFLIPRIGAPASDVIPRDQIYSILAIRVKHVSASAAHI
jgi:hypothetical protein